jgi:hypothetical protein
MEFRILSGAHRGAKPGYIPDLIGSDTSTLEDSLSLGRAPGNSENTGAFIAFKGDFG